MRFGSLRQKTAKEGRRHFEQPLVDTSDVNSFSIGVDGGVGVVEAPQLSSTEVAPCQKFHRDKFLRRGVRGVADVNVATGSDECDETGFGNRPGDVAVDESSENVVPLPVEVEEKRLGRRRRRRWTPAAEKPKRQRGQRHRSPHDRTAQESGSSVQTGKPFPEQERSEEGGLEFEPLPNVPAEADHDAELDRGDVEQVDADQQQEKVAKFSTPRKFLYVV